MVAGPAMSRLLGAAFVFVAAIIAWVGTTSLLMFALLQHLGILRVPSMATSARQGPPRGPSP